jgi:HTH-type transcriptional regulator/antitoxin HigA
MMTIALTKPTKFGYRLGRWYLELLERFPLMAIRSVDEYDRATDVVQDLLGRDDLNSDQVRYLDALIVLVSAYEAKVYDFDRKLMPPIQILKQLLEDNEMTTADLGRLIRSSSYASMILKGNRPISKAVAKRLAERFKVDAGLFL